MTGFEDVLKRLATGEAIRDSFDRAVLEELDRMFRLTSIANDCTGLALGTFGPEILKLRRDVARLRARVEHLQMEVGT